MKLRHLFLLAGTLLLAGCAPAGGETPAPSAAPTPTATAAPTPALTPAPTPEPTPEPADGDFVRVADHIPDIQVELKYATDGNFTGQVIYDFSDAWLRYGTVKKLAAVQTALAREGYGLKIWDAFRPPAAQFTLWDICPDPDYVADPRKGHSSHSRGNTVDVTLVALDGSEVVMPTEFDDFSGKADREYSDLDPLPAAHSLLLEEAMKEAGFKPYSAEWWHFSDTDVYDVENQFIPGD